MTRHVLAIDQGTTSTRAIVFRADGTIAAIAQQEFPQHFPQPGWVEHDPEDLWRTVLATCRDAIANAGLAAPDIARRPPPPKSHRVAGPPPRRHLPQAQGRRPRIAGRGAHRPRARSLFL